VVLLAIWVVLLAFPHKTYALDLKASYYSVESLKAEGWFQKAIPPLEKAESINNEDKSSMRTLMTTLANCYRMLGKMDKSTEYTDKAKNTK
jgi:tetratricopeptide (TPR) repeat protein